MAFEVFIMLGCISM